MRRFLPNLLIICCILSLSACSASRNQVSRTDDMYDAREKGKGCFVQLKDGQFKHVKTLELVKGIGKTPHLLADGNTRYYPQDIICYQTEDQFAISSQHFLKGGQKGKVASEALPGFAARLRKGKLNIYVMKYSAGAKVKDEFYFQQGCGREVLVYSPELMDALIKNMPEALDFFNDYKKYLKKNKDLTATAYIFTNTYVSRRK
ncbi:MAG TPA: hypothetical protein PKW54_05960 [Ferruginibacter sp.]|nr:hypothetical protein [Ferruginibacter sp.]